MRPLTPERLAFLPASGRVNQMLPRPVPELTRRQWEFIVERLDKPAPRKMQLRLQEALAAAREIRIEE